MKWMGGERGARRPQSTFYPSVRPGASSAEIIRQAVRHYNQAPRIVSSNASSSGRTGYGGASDTGLVSEYETRLPLNVIDNTTVYVGLGLVSAACAYFIDYYARRNHAAPSHATGRIEIVCDGTSAFCNPSATIDPAAAELGVTFDSDVNAGNIRLIVTTTAEVGAPSADLIFFIKQVLIP